MIFTLRTRFFSSKGSVETILNPLNIQILGKSLTQKVFPSNESSNSSLTRLQMQTLELSRNHLESHSIPWRKDRQLLPEISGNSIPRLLGESGTIKEHFMRMACDLGEEYFKLAYDFSKMNIPKSPGIESMKLIFSSTNPYGWFKWNSSSDSWENEDEGPRDKVIVFDVETCPQISQFPVLACAYGSSGWYVWLAKPIDANALDNDLDRLIPLKHPILVIGHHVAFDRARIAQEYINFEQVNCRFLDTLSMHCAVAGLCSQQRGLWKERKKKKLIFEETEMESEVEEDEESLEIDKCTEKWGSRSSLNNLADALQLHCNIKLDKSVRDDILLKATEPNEIIKALPEISAYCAKDVQSTAQLFSVLFPKFLKKSPNPVTFSALLEMGSFILPVQKSEWQEYIEKCDKLHKEATESIESELRKLVDKTVIEGLKDVEAVKKDPWLGQLDWTVDPIKYTLPRFLKDGITYAKGGEPRIIGNSPWAGMPAWFKKLIKDRKVHVTPRTSIVPFLLKLKWKGKVVHLIPENGWCFERDSEAAEASEIKSEIIQFKGKQFQRIPHPGGKDENVGCVLTKNFLKYFQSGDMSTENQLIEQVLEVNSRFSFWTSYHERVKEQFVVDGEKISFILPAVQPMGTVTRRAVEKTWLTASNAKEKIVGSELKAMVKAPKGWCFVGADVDCQELWIGSLLGDAQFGWSGSSALGWMTLQGTKSDGTDLHSRTASILGMTRDNAKVFNYGRIYGAGVKYAAQLLLKFNPNLSAAEAAARSSELYHATKGKRIANRRDIFVSYSGGTESFMFNQMEAIARSSTSKTPVLSAEISDGLMSEHVDDNFITSRVNWVVQSSAVDYLHLLLVAASFLFKHYKITVRTALTIHDEVRFLVRESEKYRAGLALQIANLWTRSAFVQAVGVQDLPLSAAFFSAVDFDQVLRKEVFLSCVTPSNSKPIPPGQALDVYKLLEKCPSLGSENIESISSNNFMYNFYLKRNSDIFEGSTSGGKILNLEQEKNYLAILRKQMKKSGENNENRSNFETRKPRAFSGENYPNTSNKNPISSCQESQPIKDSKENVQKQNEFFNRWSKLSKSQIPSK